MKNKTVKNILIVSLSLFAIMLMSTLIVISFNSFIGFSTDINNNDVSTCIAVIAFLIALVWRYLYDRVDLFKR